MLAMKQSFLSLRKVGLESGAVLLAILLAFAIDAVWEERQEQERVQGYLSSLVFELSANRELLQRNLDSIQIYLRETEAYIVKVATASVESTSDQEVREMVYNMGPVPLQAVPLQHAALEDLTSGSLQSIKDASLRRKILSYARTLEFDALRQRRLEDWFSSQAGPYDEIHADLVGMGASHLSGWAGRDDIRFEIDTAAFIGNRRYGNLLASRALQLSRVIRAREQLLAELEELQGALSSSD
ncbi:MAG: hypothetical protein AAGI72_14385 [Pseudomonadota bacterium]